MPTPQERIASERQRLTELVGARENAEMLFAPKVSDADVSTAGAMVLQHLDFVTGTNALFSKCQKLSTKDVSEWAPRIWANTVAHLASVDPAVKAILLKHNSCLPDDDAAHTLLLGKVYTAFSFFLWVVASPVRPLDPNNCCILKIVILQDVLLLENINSIKNGAPGGWGWLDKSIAGLGQIAKAFDIRRIKAVATNERVYQAFLHRGFRDIAPIPGLEFHVNEYARRVELTW